MPYALQIIFAACLGLAFGSFGTMLLHRMPRGESFHGRSQCPHCAITLHWYHLVPIASFLLLGGRCRGCGSAISWRYPFVEVLAALLFALLVAQSPLDLTAPHPWQQALILLALGSAVFVLLLIAFYDFATERIPDAFLATLFLSALLYQTLQAMQLPPLNMRDAFLGAAMPLGFFGFLWIVSRERWIGSGDILLGSGLGLLLGVKLTLLALAFAYVMGACAAALLLLFRLAGRGSTLAFGPFLASGTLLALLAGESFLAQYQRIFLW